MTTFTPQRVDGRRCSECGTLRSMHLDGLRCPQAYRPDRLDAAFAALRSAINAGDAGRIFVARGDVQHLGGDPDRVDDWHPSEPPTLGRLLEGDR